MNNPFEGKAIKLATEQELNHLAELARGCGLEVERLSSVILHRRNFRKADGFAFYSDFVNNGNLPEITYSDFIASLESKPIPHEINYLEEVKRVHKDAFSTFDTSGYFVCFDGKQTPSFGKFTDAWRSAYQMMQPTPNHTEQQPDMVNHPKHYNVDGYEVIDIIDAFGLNFNMGNALKYLLRSDRKGNKEQDINKAIWYLQREINTK